MTENDVLFKVWFFIALVTIGSYQCHRASETATL
ncbi:hypothetical protein MCO_00744 [Bartonella sp. DB5-6]|nr:hypothetical protein MCO_00748 [Bartonella sp. DB5-6]EJF77865.1 hypothetical protein MCO_00744 [Bartonella sp. DB5-6]